MKVGFIGLGSMGSGMARNLIQAGHSLTVFNRSRSRTEEFQSLGAKVAGTPSEAAMRLRTPCSGLVEPFSRCLPKRFTSA